LFVNAFFKEKNKKSPSLIWYSLRYFGREEFGRLWQCVG
jgi:hypothetical protein